MVGGTCQWQLSSWDPSATLCCFLDVGPPGGRPIEDGKTLMLQFRTEYRHPSGQTRLRVVTVGRSWAHPKSDQIAAGFDQEAAVAMLGRMAIWRMMGQDQADVAAWLDKCLIKLCARFAGYTQEQADTFQLPDNFSMVPQWIFNLRRSPFMQVFGNSPDETTFCRHMLDRVGVAASLLMIQPQLIAYSLEAPPRPVLLDVQSIQPDHILLLDSYFHVVVHHGTTIAQWRNSGYQEQPQHQAFRLLSCRELLAAPLAEAERLSKGRFPAPKLLLTDQGGSQARFLLAKLNPSLTHDTPGGAGGEVIVTEDVAFDVFLDHLKKLTVIDN